MILLRLGKILWRGRKTFLNFLASNRETVRYTSNKFKKTGKLALKILEHDTIQITSKTEQAGSKIVELSEKSTSTPCNLSEFNQYKRRKKE